MRRLAPNAEARPRQHRLWPTPARPDHQLADSRPGSAQGHSDAHLRGAPFDGVNQGRGCRYLVDVGRVFLSRERPYPASPDARILRMKTKTIALFFIVIIVLFDVPLARSQAPTNRRSKYWNAQWITAPEAPQRDETVLHFKKIIELSERPQHYYVDVSADNQFAFRVNQQRAGNGPSRADLAHWRYETYDLAPLLRPGKNVFAATVWNFGTRSAIAQMSDRVGFLVHGRSEE